MTMEQLCRTLDAEVLSEGENGGGVLGAVCCDVMSRAMSGGFPGMAWITCQNNINALAVAVMIRAACIVLVDGLGLEEKELQRAQKERIWVLSVRWSSFETAGRLYGAGLRTGNGVRNQ